MGAVDNKAGHYSVSPARVGQMGTEEEEEATHVAVPSKGAPTPAPEEESRHQCRPRSTRADPRQRMPGYSTG